jgi:hypothetical protein
MSRPGPNANLTLGQVGLAWGDTVETCDRLALDIL